jgi:hypothetical protein
LHTAITTIPVPDKEIALWHLPQVILVQKLTALAFFAQTTQPVLAHQVVEVAVAVLRDVAVGTRIPKGTVTLQICLADGPCVGDSEAL